MEKQSRWPRAVGWIVVSGLMLVASLGAPAPAVHAEAPSPATAPAASDPLSPRLRALVQAPSRARSRAALSQAAGLPAAGTGSLLQPSAGRLSVDVWAADQASLAAATRVGSTVLVTRGGDGLTATLAVSVGDLAALARVPGLRSVHEIQTPSVARIARPGGSRQRAGREPACPTGSKVSQGDAQLEAALARREGHVDGTGVKVGILSDSFDARGGEAADIAAGELPGPHNPCGFTTPVKVLADDDTATATDEGRAMAQVVHDLAPGAQLLFATAFRGDLDFAHEIRALHAAGADVIVDDVTYTNEPAYQDGPIAAAIDDVTAAGTTYFSSAGNSNLTVGGKEISSYEAPHFRPARCPAALGSGYTACHDFDPGRGVSVGDQITLPAAGPTSRAGYVDAVVDWDEPMYGVTTDLDVALVDATTGQVVAKGEDRNIRSGDPSDELRFANKTGATEHLRVVVGRYGTGGTPRFKVLFLGSYVTAAQWTGSGGDTAGPTIVGHASALAADTVAATPEFDSGMVEAFSSPGPATFCWAPARTTTPSAAISPCQVKQVDFSASDAVHTSLGGQFDPFYGTSAAAPHAAAVAALLLQARPCLAPVQIRATLAATAGHIPGYRTGDEGHGLVDAAAAMANLPGCGGAPSAPSAPTVVSAHAHRMTVRWTAPVVATTPVAGYEVEALDPGGHVVAAEAVGRTTTATFASLPAGAYRFRVRTLGATPSESSARSPVEVPPFATANRFVARQFADFAGRAPTAAELTEWRSALATSGGSPAAEIVRASQFTAWGPLLDPVTRLYDAFFQRPPDTHGLGHWLTARRAGTSLDAAADSFAHSAEFIHRYGSLGNQAFVALAYRNVLRRRGDVDGIGYWAAKLDRHVLTRGEVMVGLSESQEHRHQEAGVANVTDLFFGMLRRVPTGTELARWAPQSTRGKAALVDFLLTSAGYDARTT